MAERAPSVYLVEENLSCEGQNCSRHKLNLFGEVRLLTIQPAPAQADEAGARLQAWLKFDELKRGLYTLVRELEAGGDLLGIVLTMLFRGFGGQEVCDRYARLTGHEGQCQCRPNMSNPHEEWLSPPMQVPVEFQFNGATLTANFEIRIEHQILNAYCVEPV